MKFLIWKWFVLILRLILDILMLILFKTRMNYTLLHYFNLEFSRLCWLRIIWRNVWLWRQPSWKANQCLFIWWNAAAGTYFVGFYCILSTSFKHLNNHFSLSCFRPLRIIKFNQWPTNSSNLLDMTKQILMKLKI